MQVADRRLTEPFGVFTHLVLFVTVVCLCSLTSPFAFGLQLRYRQHSPAVLSVRGKTQAVMFAWIFGYLGGLTTDRLSSRYFNLYVRIASRASDSRGRF